MGDWTPPMLYLRGGRYLDSRTPAATLRRASSVDQAVMARIVLYRLSVGLGAESCARARAQIFSGDAVVRRFSSASRGRRDTGGSAA